MGSLFVTDLEDSIDELLDVLLSDHFVGSVGAELNLLATVQTGDEVLINTRLKVGIRKLLGVLLHIVEDLPGVSIEALQVIHNKRLIVELLPENWGQVERDARLGSEGVADQDSKHLEQLSVSRIDRG